MMWQVCGQRLPAPQLNYAADDDDNYIIRVRSASARAAALIERLDKALSVRRSCDDGYMRMRMEARGLPIQYRTGRILSVRGEPPA